MTPRMKFLLGGLMLAGAGLALSNRKVIADVADTVSLVPAWSGGRPIGLIRLKSVGKSADSGRPVLLEASRADAFLAMQAAAAAAGVRLLPNSGFRSMSEQTLLWAAYVARGFAAPKVAKPGESNHQDGTAIDVKIPPGGTAPNSPQRLASAEYRWLRANASRFGFFNNIEATKETWHWSGTGR